jgi:hypothetical protein
MARVPTEPARAAPAVTGTPVVVAVPLPALVGAPVPVALVVMVEASLVVVAAAEVEPLVVEAAAEEEPVAAVVAAAEEELELAAELEAGLEATAAQNLAAAGRTWLIATSVPQAATTSAVAAVWILFWLSVVHWQA